MKHITHLEDLTPDPHNANRGTQRGDALLEVSLRSYGAGRSILADKDGVLIAGGKTHAKAVELGLKVREVHTNGDELVVVVRDDLSLATDPAARELAYADNRVGQVDLDFDPVVLAADLEAGVDLSKFWFEPELAVLLEQALTPPEPGAGGDEFDATPGAGETRVQPGDLWALGPHRLLCGDSTNATDVDRLLGAVKPLLMVTDPPYGVDYDPEWRNDAAEKGLIAFAARREGKVANDTRADWSEAWALFPGDVVYCWSSDRYALTVGTSLEQAGFAIRAQIIWAKPRFVISRGHYHFQHEPCWYAVRKGATADWVGDHSQTTLWQIPMRDDTQNSDHGTQKPLDCMQRPMQNHGQPGGAVYDPFFGSGTTLIAAHRTGRVAYGLEIEPHYCDVILRRASAEGIGPIARVET